MGPDAKAKITVAIALAVACGVAFAQAPTQEQKDEAYDSLASSIILHFWTGNDFLAAHRLSQTAYVAAIGDANRLFVDSTHAPPCLPAQGSVGQLTDVVIKAINDQPATRHRPAAVLVYRAIARAFPCTPFPSR